MSVFYQEVQSKPSRRSKWFASTLKGALAKCHSYRGKLSVSSSETEEPVIDFDAEEKLFVSAIISKYMESKGKRKSTLGISGFYQAPFPTTEDLVVYQKARQKEGNDVAKGEEFFLAGTHLSRCSSATSFDAFISDKTTFSRCSSFNKINFQDFGKRSITMEFSQCEGWPFGLCRKAFLPPLPKSPSNSWSWRNGGRMIKIHA